MRLIDSCITQLKAQGPSRTCNESKEEEEENLTAEPKEKIASTNATKIETARPIVVAIIKQQRWTQL